MNICMCLYSRQFIKSKYLLKVKYFKVNDVKYKLNFKMMIAKMVEGEGSFFFWRGRGRGLRGGSLLERTNFFVPSLKKNIQFFRIFIFRFPFISIIMKTLRTFSIFEYEFLNFIMLNYWGRVRTLRPL